MTTTTMTEIEKRTCRQCKEEKEIVLFEIDSRIEGGYTNRCKACKFESDTKPAKAFRRLYERQDKYPIPIETSRKEFEQLYEVWHVMCIYCLKHFDGEETPSFDHVVPLSNSDSRNHISNIQICCVSCNSKKGNRPLYVFYDEAPSFHNRQLEIVVKHVAHFSGRTIEEVDAEFERHYEEYMQERKKEAS